MMKHHCRLPDNTLKHILPPLHPNAPLSKKVGRRLQEFITVDMKNRKCRGFFSSLQSPMRIETKKHVMGPYFYIIHPFSKLSYFLDGLFFVVWLWRYFTVPIFFSISYGIYSAYIKHPTYLVDFLQIILVISTFFTGLAICHMKKIIMEPKKIAKHYLKTYFFFDLIVIIHSILINGTNRSVLVSWKNENILIFAPLIAYLVRFRSFRKSWKNLIVFYTAKKTLFVVFHHSFQLIYLNHLFTCLIYSIPFWFYDEIPEGSLIEIVKSRSSSLVSKYIECYLIVMCHFFAIDYEVETRIPLEQVILCVIMFTGRLYTLFLIADLLRVFGVTSSSESEYERYLGHLNALMKSKNLSIDLRKKLVNYYERKFMKNHFNENQIYSDLDEFMTTEIFLFTARKLLQKIEGFRLISRTQIKLLFEHKEVTIYLANDLISRKDSFIDKIYFICYGTVAVLNKDDQEIAHIEDGDQFGLISYWTSHNSRHIFSHVAVETCEIFAVSTKKMDEFFRMNPDALRYFEDEVRDRIEFYKRCERTSDRGGADLLSELRKRAILEQPTRRPFVLE